MAKPADNLRIAQMGRGGEWLSVMFAHYGVTKLWANRWGIRRSCHVELPAFQLDVCNITLYVHHKSRQNLDWRYLYPLTPDPAAEILSGGINEA